MMGHKICFYGEIWLIIPKLSLLPLLMGNTARSLRLFWKGNAHSLVELQKTDLDIWGHSRK